MQIKKQPKTIIVGKTAYYFIVQNLTSTNQRGKKVDVSRIGTYTAHYSVKQIFRKV